MEITLDLVSLKTAINPTSIGHIAATHTRTLGEFPPGIMAHFTEDMANMGIGFLLVETVAFLMGKSLIFVGAGVGLIVALRHPQVPVCVVAF
jgi:predicted permease